MANQWRKWRRELGRSDHTQQVMVDQRRQLSVQLRQSRSELNLVNPGNWLYHGDNGGVNSIIVHTGNKLWPISGGNGGGNSVGVIVHNKLWSINGGNWAYNGGNGGVNSVRANSSNNRSRETVTKWWGMWCGNGSCIMDLGIWYIFKVSIYGAHLYI